MKPFVYALSTCLYCQKTKKYLQEKGIDFDHVDVDLAEEEAKKQIIDEVMALTGDVKFPVVKVGDRYVVGYNEEKFAELLPELR